LAITAFLLTFVRKNLFCKDTDVSVEREAKASPFFCAKKAINSELTGGYNNYDT
jgi:hypothetical protein